MDSFAVRFTGLRKQRGWTQEQMARELGSFRPTIAGYEVGKRVPRWDELVKIADIFDVTLDFLLGRKQESDEGNAQVCRERLVALEQLYDASVSFVEAEQAVRQAMAVIARLDGMGTTRKI